MFGVLEIMLLCFCVGVTKLLLLVSHKYWKLINIKKKKKKTSHIHLVIFLICCDTKLVKKFIQNFVYINAHTNL